MKHSTPAFLALCVALVACGDDTVSEPAIDLSALQSPSVESAPWTRWWWPGADVDVGVIEAQLDWMASVGFGGVEVQAFDAALDPNRDAPQRVHEVRSAAFADAVEAAVLRAEALEMGVDFTVGTGWPVGGTGVDVDEASTTLMWWERTVTGPMELDVEPMPTPTVFFTVADIAAASFGERLGRFLPELAEPVAVYAGRVVDGRRDPSPLALDDTVVLLEDSLVDLTDALVDGRLTWTVPTGRWHVVAVYAGPAGDYLTLTAETGDPFAADHLDAAAIGGVATRWFADWGAERWGRSNAWRGVFVDSLEFKVDRLFTDDFLEQFEERRGYALGRRILLALAQSADSFLLDAGRVSVAPELAFGDDDDAIRWDYRQTVSELFVERYVGALGAWAAGHDAVVRSQSYGIDVDVLAALGAADIPETETLYAGGSRLFLKMASSAAHTHGRPLTSSEAFSFILRDHMTTPLKVRAVADLQFLAGVNHLVFHGVPYPAAGAYGVPGWTPFSSPFGGASTFGSTFGERWEFADRLPQLNRYVARSQSLLREGAPAADFLIVYPFFGFPTSLALSEEHYEPLLGGHLPEAETASRDVPFGELAALLGPPVEDERTTWLVALSAALDLLESCGWTWDWVSPAQLGTIALEDGQLALGGATYGAVAVVETEALTVDAVEALADLAESGASVWWVGARPASSPSFAERDDAARVSGAVARASATLGALIVPELSGWADALADETPRVATECGGAQRVMWRTDSSGAPLVAFVSNLLGTASAQRWAVPGCESGLVYDAWSHTAAVWDGEVSLAPYSSAFVVCDAAWDGAAPSAPDAATEGREILGWRLTSRLVVPDSEFAAAAIVEREDVVLADWREDPELATRSGVATYEASLVLSEPAVASESAWLELGWLHGAAQVFVNDASAGAIDTPPWRVDVGQHLVAGENAFRIEVVPPIRNELIALGEAGDPEYAHFAGKTGTEVGSGVVGPVLLRGVR